MYFVKLASIAACAAADDVRRRREVRLPCAEVDDVDALRLQAHRLGRDLHRRRDADPLRAFRKHASQALRVSRACLLLAQPLFDDVGHEPGHRAAERDDFLDEPRADVGVGFGRHHEHRLDLRVEAAVHQRHLHLVLEVGDGAQAADDDAGALASSVVDEQAVEGVHFDVGDPAEHVARDLDPLGDGEERRLLEVDRARRRRSDRRAASRAG